MPSRRKIYEGSAASPPNRLKIIALLIVLVAGLAFYRFADRRSVEAGTFPTPVRFVGADSSALGFAPTIENKKAPPGAAPEGMAWIPGGEFSMGAQDPPDMNTVGMQATLDSRPIHRVYVDGFWMDKTDITNREFSIFVQSTGYVTIAERKLSMVVIRSWGKLATSPRSEEQHPGKDGLSGCADCVSRRSGLCEMGWQAIAHGGRMGIRCEGRSGRQAVCLGR
jgi:formylglycine-generating enzyme required for sulfatase activity